MDTQQKVQVTVSKDCLLSELLQKIIEHPHIPKGTSYRLYTSDGTSFQDDKDNKNQRLSHYQITNKSTISLSVGLAGGVWPTLEELERQQRDPKPSGKIQITTSKDHPDVLGLDYDNPRVIMPCGHAIEPHSLAYHCYHELENKKPEITCPGNNCNTTWPFSLVREAACLSDEETTEFEQRLLMNRRKAGVQQCPNCFIYCHRHTDNETRVGCLNCKSKGRENYEFCWNCLCEWKGNGSDACGNPGCNESFRILAECKTIDLLKKQCPSVRACPNCFLNIEYLDGCKHMTCSGCKHEFCFMCLGTHEWPAQSFQTCFVAPRQTLGVSSKLQKTPVMTSSSISLNTPVITASNLTRRRRLLKVDAVRSHRADMTSSNLSLPTSGITSPNVNPRPDVTSSHILNHTSDTSDKKSSKKRSRLRKRCLIM